MMSNPIGSVAAGIKKHEHREERHRTAKIDKLSQHDNIQETNKYEFHHASICCRDIKRSASGER